MLEYVTLGILCVGLTLVFYTFVYVHDIPYEIAKKRNHPQVEAIHVACILSLFTLHALWPLVFIWAVIKPAPLRFALSDSNDSHDDEQQARIEEFEARLVALEAGQAAAEEGAG